MSFHGQFVSTEQFRGSLQLLMAIRQVIRGSGREFYCHRELRNARVFGETRMAAAVNSLRREERQAWLGWITREAPLWDAPQHHDEEDWFETSEEICTSTALAEGAWCIERGERRDLVSVDPSDWLTDPVTVTRVVADHDRREVQIRNHWSVGSVTACLATVPITLESWEGLAQFARNAFTHLGFAQNAFDPLDGLPFVPSVAEQIKRHLKVLDELKQLAEANAYGDQRYRDLYDNHFMGANAWFSDESTTNRREFAQKMTFANPQDPAQFLFCPWHGKPNTPGNFVPIRIHFSWPITPTTPLYIVYVGRKLTMR
jgi:hypothetical protein